MANEKIDVLIIWNVRNELKKYIQNGLDDFNVNLIFPDKTDEEDFLKYAKDVDIIVGWRPTEKLLNQASKLRLYINPGAGVQHLLELFRNLDNRHKITLVNGHGNSYFTAQHIVAILLALTNKVIPHHNWMREGKWRLGDKHAKSIPLRNKRVGFMGYGKVNKKVHKFLSNFDISFSIYRKHWTKDKNYPFPTKIDKYKPSDLNEFLETSNIVIIALPLTKETKGLIGKKEIELLGKNGLLVNAGRGSIVKEKDLYQALKTKAIAGAALDVWYNYGPEPDEDNKKFPSAYPFYELNNVVLSPHRSASPFDDLKRWDEVIENIKRFTRNENTFLNEVNLEEGY